VQVRCLLRVVNFPTFWPSLYFLLGFMVKSYMLLLHYALCTFHSFVVQIMCVQSIFHVSHLRGLFPSQLFKTVDMPNLGGEATDVTLNVTGY